jgi:hypothetical protein
MEQELQHVTGNTNVLDDVAVSLSNSKDKDVIEDEEDDNNEVDSEVEDEDHKDEEDDQFLVPKLFSLLEEDMECIANNPTTNPPFIFEESLIARQLN